MNKKEWIWTPAGLSFAGGDLDSYLSHNYQHTDVKAPNFEKWGYPLIKFIKNFKF